MTTLSTSNKTALITGASSGIGKALAHQFAQDGYQLVLAARGVAKMQALADELQRKFKVAVTVIGADLETNDGAARLHADIKARGIVLSALANNAGYGAFGEFKDSALTSELAMMQLNMNTVVVLTKLFLPDLLATRGKILNTASTAAFQPGPYMAVYYATKSFVLSFSEAIASELEDTGVTVTALCPGPTASGFQDKAATGDVAVLACLYAGEHYFQANEEQNFRNIQTLLKQPIKTFHLGHGGPVDRTSPLVPMGISWVHRA